jgi:hypothetical protein
MRKTPWGAVQRTPGTTPSMRSEAAVAPRRFLAITAAMALILSLMAVYAVPAFGGPNGNDEQGHVKIHEGPGEPDPEVKNEPKVCTLHIHGFNFHAGEEIVWEIRAKGEHGWQDGSVVLTGEATADSEGEWRDPEASAHSLPDGHYKLFVDRAARLGGPMKHKVFKVECEAEVSPTSVVTTTTTAPTTTTTAPTTTTTAPTTTTTAGEGGGAELALLVEKSATQNDVTLDVSTSATSNEAILFMVTITNSSSGEVEITDIEDDVFGELEGEADCEVGTELAASASCSFTFEKTLNVDLTSEQLEALLETETHTNVVTVLGVDVETSANVMGEASLTFPVVLTDVLGIGITAPTTTAPAGPVTPVDTEAGAVGDEVLAAQVEAEQLPFTGIETERLIGLAIMLLGGGALLLGGTTRRQQS